MSRLAEYALPATVEECQATLRRVLGVTASKGQADRIVRRILLTYAEARHGKLGSRMKESTRQMSEMEVGEVIEVEATCRANLHGQMKTIRRLTGNTHMKWRCDQLRPMVWRVERLEDNANPMLKSPIFNEKALFLASLPVRGPWTRVPFPECYECNRINTDFTKNKARQVLKDTGANWQCKRVRGSIAMRRVS